MFLLRKRDPLPSRNAAEFRGEISKGYAPALLLCFRLVGDLNKVVRRCVTRPAEVTFHCVKSVLPRDESVEIGMMRCDRPDCETLVGLRSTLRHVFVPRRAMSAVRPRKQPLADAW